MLLLKTSSYKHVHSKKLFNSGFHLNMAALHFCLADAEGTDMRQGKK